MQKMKQNNDIIHNYHVRKKHYLSRNHCIMLLVVTQLSCNLEKPSTSAFRKFEKTRENRFVLALSYLL